MSSIKRPPNTTYDKCQRILTMFQQIGNQHSQRPSAHRQSAATRVNQAPYYISQSTNKKNNDRNCITRNSSASKSVLKQNLTLLNSNSKNNQRESMMFRDRSASSFISSYKKESRLDKIMKLKVNKPSIHSIAQLKAQRKTINLNSSLSSLNSSRSSLNKENNFRKANKASRLDKIMKIKVEKPKINSTLINYRPQKVDRSASKSISKKNSLMMMNQTHSTLQLKQCKRKQRKQQQINEKQDQLWKIFERERQLQLKQKQKQQQEEYKQQRRKQERFQKLVQKQLRKIQFSRESSLRKGGVFSPYVYPSY